MNFDDSIKQLKELFTANRWDEARQLLTKLIDEAYAADPATGASAYLELMTVYLAALTDANRNYAAALDEGIGMLKTLKKEEQLAKDQTDLARLHSEIDQLKKG